MTEPDASDDVATGRGDGARGGAARWPRRPEVQGLRAVAVVAVVAFHAGLPVDGGFLGVDAFFVISGWALGGVLAAERAETGRIRIGRYLARRSRRLLPLLAVVVGVGLVAHVLTSNPYVGEEVVPRTALAGLAFSANLYLYRNTGYFDVEADATNPFLHLWSLSAEEQLYLVLPAVLLLGWRISRRRRGPISVAAVTAAGSLVLAAAATSGALDGVVEAGERFAFYAPFTRAWEVAVGVLVALVPMAWARRRGPAAVAVVIGAVPVVASFVALDARAGVPFPAAVPVVVGTALLLAAAPHAGAVSAPLAAAPVRWVGDRSYGWYLWHWPLIVIAERVVPGTQWVPVVAGLAALGLAAVTYPLVEERFRHDPVWVGPRALALSVAVLSIPASLAVVAGTGASHGWGLTEPLDWYDTPLGTRSGCLIVNRDLPDEWDPTRCRTGPDDGTGTVLVLGDSAVISATPAVVAAAGAQGLATAEWARSGCPFVDRPVAGYDRCGPWQDAAWDLIDELDPEAVVIANRSLDHAGTPSLRAGGEAPGLEGAGPRTERWGSALDATLDELAARDIPAVVLGPVPDFGTDFPRSRLWPLRPHPGVPVLDRAEVDADRAEVVAAERAAVAAHPGAAHVDPVPVLCTDVCTPVLDGSWLYTDAHHLNVRGSLLLTDEVEAALASVGVGAP